MSVSGRAAAIAPYLGTLVDDPEVQAAARRAVTAGRATYQRARGKDPAKALEDKQLLRRAQQTLAATWEVWVAVTAPQTRRRPRWRRRLVFVTAVATGAYVASNAEIRGAALGLFGGHGALGAGSRQ
jgi:hypothetical protein